MADNNPFVIAKKQIDQVGKILNLSPNVLSILKTPKRELWVSLPIKMDNSQIKVFQGFRVQYNDARGPFKGGIRFHPAETIDTVRALASWMTWKASLLDIPLGGAKGGIICNPKELSANELEKLSRAYIRAIYQFVGPDKDIPAPDVYTNPQIMAWMMDEYSSLSGKNQFGVITGKPLSLGGSLGRSYATAQGGLFTIFEAAKFLKINLKKATMAIQGFGNAGANMALLAYKSGIKVIAVADSKGGVLKSTELDIEKLIAFKEKTGSVKSFPGTENISGEKLLELTVDVLVPAALENVITEKNAGNIKTKILAELANGPTTPEADAILYKKGVHLIPDFLCNAGGVTVSYFEMVQNFYMYYWKEKEVNERLEEKMRLAYKSVLSTSQKYKINMRASAYVLAVSRVVEAMKTRGWF